MLRKQSGGSASASNNSILSFVSPETSQTVQDALIDFVVLTDQAVSVVEHHAFRNLMKVATNGHKCQILSIGRDSYQQVSPRIPASSAASERVFSSSGNTVSDKRNRLSPDVVRRLIFLKDAIKKVSALKSICV